MHTSYSYHISLTFDLHNCISTKNGPKIHYLLCFTLTLSQKRVKKPIKRKGQKTTKNNMGKKIPCVTTLGQKTLGPYYKYIVKGSPNTPFFLIFHVWVHRDIFSLGYSHTPLPPFSSPYHSHGVH